MIYIYICDMQPLLRKVQDRVIWESTRYSISMLICCRLFDILNIAYLILMKSSFALQCGCCYCIYYRQKLRVKNEFGARTESLLCSRAMKFCCHTQIGEDALSSFRVTCISCLRRILHFVSMLLTSLAVPAGLRFIRSGWKTLLGIPLMPLGTRRDC